MSGRSAGDADYDAIGAGYARLRRPEPRIAARIHAALGGARRVLNVGAGAGSYEPPGRTAAAVEPSAAMRVQRAAGLAPAVGAAAERLPFADGAFDAAMATFTVHQWRDLRAGLREMRRVARGPIVVLTCDPDAVRRFWLNAYAPEVLDAEARRYPSMAAIADALGGAVEILGLPIPLDCRDGFNEAYYGRPEMLLRPEARRACSAWSFVDAATCGASVGRLADDLRSGAWDRAHGELRRRPEYDGSLRLVVATPDHKFP